MGKLVSVPTGKRIVTFKPWTPAEITTAAWYDASDSDTITESGGSVSQWDDKSGNGRHAAQGTGANQPVLVQNTLGGLPGIDFDGSNDILSLGGTNFATRNVFAVINAEDGPDFSYWNWVFGTQEGTDVPALFGQGGGTNILTEIPIKFGRDATLYLNGSGTLNNYIEDFSPLSDYKFVAVIGNSASAVKGGWQIGNGDGAWDGKINELIVTTTACDAATREKFEGYLAHKWGLAANLPSGHPYKNSLPTV